MKRNLLLFALLCCAFLWGCKNKTQTLDEIYDLRISEIELSENNIQSLTDLGMVWGFLKYYHPDVAEGDYNWDVELFKMLPVYLEADGQKERDSLLLSWLPFDGDKDENYENAMLPLNAYSVPDLDWIGKAGFSANLESYLQNVKTAQRPDYPFYGPFEKAKPNFFYHEDAYAEYSYPGVDMRLLSLFRFWNMIEYYFPYKYLIGQDWKPVLKAFIPKFVNAQNETEYQIAVNELICTINDTHAKVTNDKMFEHEIWGDNTLPIAIKFVNKQPTVYCFTKEKAGEMSGFLPGDVLQKVNGVKIEEMINAKIAYCSSSNRVTKFRVLAENFLRTNDSQLDVQVLRGDEVVNIKAATIPYSTDLMGFFFMSKDKALTMINPDIALINNSSLKRKDIPEVWEKVEHTKGLILDLRNYPSDFPIDGLCRKLLPDTTNWLIATKPDMKYPGVFTATKGSHAGVINHSDYYKGKVVILINEFTQSSSEFHAMAYRAAPNAKVIGSTTAAADGNVVGFTFPGGLESRFTGYGIYYADGSETQRIGIIPDIECWPTVKGIAAGEDEVLERAITLINTGK